MQFEFTINETELAKLKKIPVIAQFVAVDKGLKAMSKPIIVRAKQLAPNSVRSGSRKKWGKKYKTNAAWQIESGKEISSKVKKTKNGGIVWVGPTHPKGNKQQFNQSKDGRKEVQWGRRTNKIVKVEDRFMQRAFDETQGEQITAFEQSVTKHLENMNL